MKHPRIFNRIFKNRRKIIVYIFYKKKLALSEPTTTIVMIRYAAVFINDTSRDFSS